jgi:hypothetical protein
VGRTTLAADEIGVIGLLYRADWTRLALSAELGDGSTVLVAPGKRYRYQTPERLTGCDGVRAWEMPGDDEPHGTGRVTWISGPEPPMARLLCPAWLLVGSMLQVRGRAEACGREAIDVVMTPRPGVGGRAVPLHPARGPVEALVDAELGILLRVAEPGRGGAPTVTEMVSADFSPAVDETLFEPPLGSRIAESFTEAFRADGPAWWAVKTAAGLAAGGLGALIKYSPLRRTGPPRPDAADPEAIIPAEDPAPERSTDGVPAGRPADELLLALLHAGGSGELTATLHHWMDIAAMASQVPPAARQAGFGGVGLLMDAVSQRPGAVRIVSTVQLAGSGRYQIDHDSQPRRGPRTIASDGRRCWKVYADEVTVGPAEPLPRHIADLADPSWLLRCGLADGMPVTIGGRPCYKIAVTQGLAGWSSMMIYPAAVAVVDAESGVLQRLTYYIGSRAVERYELRDVNVAAAADFKVDIPVGLQVVEETTFAPRTRSRRPDQHTY